MQEPTTCSWLFIIWRIHRLLLLLLSLLQFLPISPRLNQSVSPLESLVVNQLQSPRISLQLDQVSIRVVNPRVSLHASLSRVRLPDQVTVLQDSHLANLVGNRVVSLVVSLVIALQVSRAAHLRVSLPSDRAESQAANPVVNLLVSPL